MMKAIQTYAVIGIGGMIGSCLRYLISILFEGDANNGFPWATFIVNISGAFILSFILFLPFIKRKIHPIILSGVTTGIIGSYTTFSTFSAEVFILFQENTVKALFYLTITIIGGLFFCYLGFKSAGFFKERAGE